MHRQPVREPLGGGSSIRPEELSICREKFRNAVGQLKRLGPRSCNRRCASEEISSRSLRASRSMSTARRRWVWCVNVPLSNGPGRGLTGGRSKRPRRVVRNAVSQTHGPSRSQIALEANGSRFLGELDDNVKVPRSMRRGVRTAPSLVVRQPGVHSRRETDIQTRSAVSAVLTLELYETRQLPTADNDRVDRARNSLTDRDEPAFAATPLRRGLL